MQEIKILSEKHVRFAAFEKKLDLVLEYMSGGVMANCQLDAIIKISVDTEEEWRNLRSSLKIDGTKTLLVFIFTVLIRCVKTILF